MSAEHSDSRPNTSTSRNNSLEKQLVEQQPHTLRLLRLIRDGNHEHAEAAALQLSALATTSFSPMQLWDILGRLQENLTCSVWRTRSNAARALEGVASALPVLEQRRFLTTECDAAVPFNDDPCYNKFLKISDILEEKVLDNILENGRRLMATSGNSYDKAEEEALAFLDEKEIARANESLEESHQLHKIGSPSTVSQNKVNNFVEERIKLQRHIMAKKLGLSAVFDGIATPERYMPLDIITNDDILEPSVVGNHKRMKLTDQIQKRNKESEERHESSPFLRSLMISEARRSELHFEGNASCHRTPQKLLASEFVYRMFDPRWYVRHGALLGVLSILRAWKSTTLDGIAILSHGSRSSKSGQDGSEPVHDNMFGVWPEDILARCICVLALDRFGDFSGALVGENEHLASNVTASGVVAPCREVAGQLVAILTTMAPIHVKQNVLNLLQQCSRYSDAWEVRHGALVSGKFLLSVVSVTRDRMFSHVDVLKRSSWTIDVIDAIASTAILCLNDTSDDVISAAVQVLEGAWRILRDSEGKTTSDVSDNHPLNILLKQSIPEAWNALQQAKNFSSCIVDLLNFISLVMEYNAMMFYSSIASSAVDYSSGLTQVVSLILGLFNSDYPSVRLVALRTVRSLAKSFSLVVAANRNQAFTYLLALREAYCTLTRHLFEMFYSNVVNVNAADSDDGSLEDAFRRILKDAWVNLCNASNSVFSERSSILELEISLLSRYFHVHHERTSLHVEIHNYVEAADNLAMFLTNPGKLGVHAVVAIQIFLESPWFSQCEQACFLMRSLSESLGESLTIFHVSLDPSSCPLCLQMGDEDLHATLQNNLLAKEFDSHVLESLALATKASEARPDVAANAIKYFQNAIQEKFSPTGRRKPNFCRLRIEASVAGAMLLIRIPEKITPLVRALMTSFRNEKSSKSRQLQTCLYLVDLLKTIHMNPHYESAETKILSTICESAASEWSESVLNISVIKPGSFILQKLVSRMETYDSLDCFTPLREKLDLLISDNKDADKEWSDAICLIRVVTGGLVNGHISCSVFVRKYLPPLVAFGCENFDEHVRESAVAAVVDLCALCTSDALHLLIPKVTEYLEEVSLRLHRLPTCLLLHKVVLAAGKEICPYLRQLIPRVLNVMANTDEKCSKAASSLFASLVQLAPLVQVAHEDSDAERSSNDNDVYDVIDHLIFGKPLPPCKIPIDIENCLVAANVKLRQYQIEGVSWLHLLQTVNINGALCDSMGLGKTLQALIGVAMAHSKHRSDNKEQISLVVCPSTIVGHWFSEIQKFFPGNQIFRPLCVVGDADDVIEALSNGHNIVVTSYSVLRKQIKILQNLEWLYVVLDEGHLLKNPKTATAIASRTLRARHKVILTGTPIQNKITELWATFDFLMPNFLGSSSSFAKDFAGPISKGQMHDASASCISESMSRLKLLHQKVLPFILRREKELVLKELPPKIVTTIKVSMSSVQALYYNAYCSLSENQAFIANLDLVVRSNTDDRDLSTECMKSLLFLRLLCTHPSLVFSDEKIIRNCWNHHFVSGKMMALAQLLQEAGLYDNNIVAADNDCSLLYCNRDDEENDSLSCFSHMDHVRESNNQYSKGNSSKCLIFAQFTRSLDVVEELLLKKLMPSLNYVRLDGRVSPSARMGIVNAFNQDPSVKIMLSTTRTGGLGANIVIFLELDFNPYVDLQAMDRAHRLGQMQTVNVYRIITQNSVEEKILSLQEKKIATCEAIVNTDNSTLFSMGTDRILDIFTMDKIEEESGTLSSSVDLDQLVDCLSTVANDYASLSVEQFTQTLA